MQPTGLYNGPAFPGPFWLSHTTLLCCEIAPITAFNLQPAISSLFYGSFPRKKHRTRRLFSKNQRTSARNTNKRVESNKRTTTADDQMASEGTSNTMKPATTTPPHATQVDSRIGPNTGACLRCYIQRPVPGRCFFISVWLADERRRVCQTSSRPKIQYRKDVYTVTDALLLQAVHCLLFKPIPQPPFPSTKKTPNLRVNPVLPRTLRTIPANPHPLPPRLGHSCPRSTRRPRSYLNIPSLCSDGFLKECANHTGLDGPLLD